MSFQFLGIPPKGEHLGAKTTEFRGQVFPISRDPPEGGTTKGGSYGTTGHYRFQFLGIPPKGERILLPIRPELH